MRKIAIALGAIAFAVSAAALPAVAAPKPAKEVASESAAKPKKTLVKKAKPSKVKYASKCKAGQKWDATAGLNNGACISKKARVKVKSAPKAAKAPVSTPATKKVG